MSLSGDPASLYGPIRSEEVPTGRLLGTKKSDRARSSLYTSSRKKKKRANDSDLNFSFKLLRVDASASYRRL